MKGARAGGGGRAMLTVKVDPDFLRSIDAHAAAGGQTRSEAVRELLGRALFAEHEKAFAGLCRRAVREELNKWLDSARLQKEYAANDFYDALAASAASELLETRRIAAAALYAAVSAAAQGDPAGRGWDRWYAEALDLSWTMDVFDTLAECESASRSEGAGA